MEQIALTEETDKNLMTAHCRGDSDAFAAIVQRYGPALLGYLKKMSNENGQAEDFFQETFARVHAKASTFRGPKLKPWLYRIATNIAMDGFRKNSRLKLVSLDQQTGGDNRDPQELGERLLVDSAPGPSEAAQTAETKQQVQRAIADLPDRQRATLVLAYYQRLSYRQVAEVLGCSVGTVKTHMFRALKSLARTLPDISGGAA